MNKQPFITITEGMSGYFAVCMGWCTEREEWEPLQTGFGRYETREEAEIEAKGWSEAEELAYGFTETKEE